MRAEFLSVLKATHSTSRDMALAHIPVTEKAASLKEAPEQEKLQRQIQVDVVLATVPLAL